MSLTAVVAAMTTQSDLKRLVGIVVVIVAEVVVVAADWQNLQKGLHKFGTNFAKRVAHHRTLRKRAPGSEYIEPWLK